MSALSAASEPVFQNEKRSGIRPGVGSVGWQPVTPVKMPDRVSRRKPVIPEEPGIDVPERPQGVKYPKDPGLSRCSGISVSTYFPKDLKKRVLPVQPSLGSEP